MYTEELFIKEIKDNYLEQLYIIEAYQQEINFDRLIKLAEEARNLAEDEYDADEE